MNVRDELLRAAVYAFYDSAPKEFSPGVWHRDAYPIIRVHALAPLVEYAVQLQQAVDAEPVIRAAVDERVAQLEQLLLLERRDNVRLSAELAALQPVAPVLELRSAAA